MKDHDAKDRGALFHEVVAGLTVSFVAISLGAAFGLLSGRGAFAGIVSAGIIAFVTAVWGGTVPQCSGPTAPMTTVSSVVVAFAYDQLGQEMPGINADHFVNLVFILMGLFMILLALARVGKWIKLVPRVVESGFMNGIAVLIWLDQIKKLFGLGGKQAFGGASLENALVAVVTLALVFGLPPLTKKLVPGIAHFLPGTLIAIVLMSLVVGLTGLEIEKVDLGASIDSFSAVVQMVAAQIPRDWSLPIMLKALPFAAQLALLCYLDTLLTALVMDKKLARLGRVSSASCPGRHQTAGQEKDAAVDGNKPAPDDTHHGTSQNKELAAQGVGNALAALMGGIPGAQATIRSVLILNEGARTRLAGAMVGVFVFLELMLFQDLIAFIPQAVFAGLLFKVGYDVFDWPPLLDYLRERSKMIPHPKVTHLSMAFIAGTTLVTILWNLNAAVVLFTALFLILKRVGRIRDMQDDETHSVAHED